MHFFEKRRFFRKKRKIFPKMFGGLKKVVFLHPQIERFSAAKEGALAQLARALAWHARGHRFDSVMLHKRNPAISAGFFVFKSIESWLFSRAVLRFPLRGGSLLGECLPDARPTGHWFETLPRPSAVSHPSGHRWDRSPRRRRGYGQCRLSTRCWPCDGQLASVRQCT